MNALYGIGLKIASTVMFAIMLALIKYTAETMPIGEVIFFRCLFAIPPLFLVTALQGDWRDCIRTNNPWSHVRRSVVGATSMFCWFVSITLLPLPEATAISFINPMMIVALAAIFLKETVRAYRWTAVAVSFVGVLIILSPRLAASSGDVGLLGAVLCLASTTLGGLAGILIRLMTKTEKSSAIVFYFFVTATLFSSFSAYWGWIMPDARTFGLMVLAGVFGGLGQILMTRSYSVAEASLIAPFDYVNVVWNVIIAIVLFSEYPSHAVLVGGSIVVLAGLFVVYRERQLGVSRKVERQVKSA
nr:DMT family transporter [uncultured Cohaesibacter sp.]